MLVGNMMSTQQQRRISTEREVQPPGSLRKINVIYIEDFFTINQPTASSNKQDRLANSHYN